jgi:DNA-directed RNA polymerase II subunit RPB1
MDAHHHDWVIGEKEKVAMKVGNKLEHTTLSQIINSTSIFYDPDPANTIIEQDKELVEMFNDLMLD